MPHSKQLVLSETQIQDRVRELASRLDDEYAHKHPVLVGVLTGVFRFIADLTRHMQIPLQIDFVRVSSYGMNSKSSGQIRFTKDVELDLKGRHVIVVEDIVDSGLTLSSLSESLKERGAASVKICALIDKLERRDYSVPLDYVGFTVEKGFLVGYGLDYAEEYRSLNAIYHLMIE